MTPAAALYRTSIVCLAALCLTPLAPAQEFTAAVVAADLVPDGARWKYHRGVTAPAGEALAWTRREFDDGAWQEGRAGFGYGDDDDATVLDDMADAYSTVYLRMRFEVAGAGGVESLVLRIDYDDGFIAFLNGVEIARANAGSLGSYPEFDDLASASHEAGETETFVVATSAEILVDGTNVLAVLGLNRTIDSGDFTLRPALGTGGSVVTGCDGDYYVAEDVIVVEGAAPLPATTAVRVDGQPAELDPLTGAWSFRTSFSAAPGAGVRALAVEARDESGAVVAVRDLRAIRARVLAGEIADGARLSAAGGPFLVVGQLSLPAGRSLRIDAGCELLFLPDVGFDIAGEVQALGTREAPILFSRVPCGDNWGFFSMDGARGDNRFVHCEWSWSTGDPGCLTVDDSDLELESCILRDVDGEGVHATDSTTRIRRCLTERTREALSLDSGDTVVEFCTIRDAIGDSDLIDTNGSTDPPARIAFNHIYSGGDDGIDADRGSIIAIGNVIHDCADQAFSLVGAGHSTVIGNLCYRNGHGLSVKDSHVCDAELNTFVGQAMTGVRAIEDNAGRGSGVISLRSSIVWGNATQLFVDAEGVIDVAYANVEGPLVAGPGNLNLDPLFVAAAAGDYHLSAGSPCIGAGPMGEDIGAFPLVNTSQPPQVLGIEPAEGLATGGTTVVIRGRSFVPGVVAALGSAPIVDLILVREDELRGRTPAAISRGPVDVVVTTPHGQASLTAGFHYIEAYRRGDANGDGGFDLADAIAVLDFLFRNGAPPPCRDTADANSDSAVDVSDAVFSLLYLFAGGSSPEPDTANCRGGDAAP